MFCGLLIALAERGLWNTTGPQYTHSRIAQWQNPEVDHCDRATH